MKLKFNTDGFEDLRFDPRVRGLLYEKAKEIADRAGGEEKGYIIRENRQRRYRAGVTVFATGHAGNSNRKHRTLIKALAGGG